MLTELRLMMVYSTRIYVSGASGNLGSEIIQRLKANPVIEVIALKRDAEDSYVGDLIQRGSNMFDGKESFIHCGWNVANRTIDAQKKSMEDTKALAEICKLRSINMIFMSSKSASGNSPSNYGAMKYLAEKCILNSGGISLRPGLVLFDPPKGIQKRIASSRRIYLKVKFKPDIFVETIQVEKLLDEIQKMLQISESSGNVCSIRNESIGINQLIERSSKKFGVVINISTQKFEWILELTGRYSSKCLALYDSWKSIHQVHTGDGVSRH